MFEMNCNFCDPSLLLVVAYARKLIIYSKFGLWIFLICSSNSLIDLNLDSQSLQIVSKNGNPSYDLLVI